MRMRSPRPPDRSSDIRVQLQDAIAFWNDLQFSDEPVEHPRELEERQARAAAAFQMGPAGYLLFLSITAEAGLILTGQIDPRAL